MAEKFRVLSVGIEGFRGFSKKQVFEFEKSVSLLYGQNGVGKSSTLAAIEWACFGDIAYLRYQDRTKDEFVNQFTPNMSAQVNVVISANGKQYEIQRLKRIGRTKTELTITGPTGTVKDENVESEIFRLLNVTFEDFSRAVYLHQESVRGLLTEDSATRDEAIDRLLGLERMRNLTKAIPMSKVREEIRALDKKKQTLEGKISGAIEQVQRDLERLEDKTASAGISPGQITEEQIISKAKEIIDKIQELGKKHKFKLQEIAIPESTDECDRTIRKTRGVLKSYNMESFAAPEMDDLRSKKRAVSDLMEKYEELKQLKDDVDKNISALDKEWVSQKSATERIGDVQNRLSELGSQRTALDATSRLVQDAIHLFQTKQLDECPVCSQSIDSEKLLEHLTKSEGSDIIPLVKDVDGRISEAEELVRHLKEAAGEYGRQMTKKNKIASDLASIQVAFMRELQAPFDSLDKLEVAATEKIASVQSEMDRLEQGYESRAAEIQELQDSIEGLGTMNDVIEKRADFEGIRQHYSSETREIGELNEGIIKLRELENHLTLILDALGSAQVSVATNLTSESAEEINACYKKLLSHQFYDDLDIAVTPKERAGVVKNTYAIRALNKAQGTETIVSTRFSTGQMNCVALAIYLALSDALQHKLAFLLMDDPSQNLDPRHKEALAKLIGEVSEHSQLIVSTQDPEFRDLLVSAVRELKTYQFENWTPDRGPTVTSA